MFKWYSILILIGLSITQSIAQDKLSSLSAYVSMGKVINHATSLVVDPSEQMTWQVGLTYNILNVSDQPWRKKAKYPEANLNFIYTNFGANEVYGYAIAFYPSITFYFPPSSSFQGYFTVGTGLAYLNRRYGHENNYDNTAIGSKFNNVTAFKLGLAYKLKKVKFFTNASLTHFSNAAVKRPNLGLNYFSAALGLQYHFRDFSWPENVVIDQPDNKWGLGAKIGVGVYDRNDDPYNEVTNYQMVQTISVGAIFKTSIINQVNSGLKYTINYGQRSDDGSTSMHNLSWYIGDEVRLGRTGLFGTIGLYLYEKYDNDAIIYAELGCNYYFIQKEKHSAFIGVNLKTHFGTAEYPELNFGWTVF